MPLKLSGLSLAANAQNAARAFDAIWQFRDGGNAKATGLRGSARTTRSSAVFNVLPSKPKYLPGGNENDSGQHDPAVKSVLRSDGVGRKIC